MQRRVWRATSSSPRGAFTALCASRGFFVAPLLAPRASPVGGAETHVLTSGVRLVFARRGTKEPWEAQKNMSRLVMALWLANAAATVADVTVVVKNFDPPAVMNAGGVPVSMCGGLLPPTRVFQALAWGAGVCRAASCSPPVPEPRRRRRHPLRALALLFFAASVSLAVPPLEHARLLSQVERHRGHVQHRL